MPEQCKVAQLFHPTSEEHMLGLVKQCFTGEHNKAQVPETVYLCFRDEVLKAVHPDVLVRLLKVKALQRQRATYESDVENGTGHMCGMLSCMSASASSRISKTL